MKRTGGPNRGSRGEFTLKELLTMTGLIIVGLVLAFPFVLTAIRRAQINENLNRGRTIYYALFPQGCSPLGLTAYRPECPKANPNPGERRFANSSEFLEILVSSNVLDTDCAFFAAPGSRITPARSAAEFLDGNIHNSWCIAQDVNDSLTAYTPVIFTQNLKFKRRGSTATLDQMIGLEPDAEPYGDRAGIVIYRGGWGTILNSGTASLTNFNSRGMTNGFLWPLASGQALSK